MSPAVKSRRIALAAIMSIGLFGANARAADGQAPGEAADRPGIDALVDRQLPDMTRNARLIWDYSETGFAEWRSSALLRESLRKAGFSIDAGIAGMPTAFIAHYRTGPGPVIALLAEFDALPGLSQKAGSTHPDPIAGKAAGHACGHNLLGSGAVGAAVAISQWMKTHGIMGEIRLYGTPAEERGDAKAYLVRDGFFRDVNAVVHWHPSDQNGIFNLPTQANIKTAFTFHGVASHAAAAPENGRSALAGVELMDAGVNIMRQFVPDGSRIHGIVTDGGAAPNVVPAIARSTYYVRHVDVATLRSLQERLLKVARGAATATETEVSWEIEGGVYPVLVNDTLARIAYDKLRPEIADLRRNQDEQNFSNAIRASLHASEPEGAPSDITPLEPLRPFAAGSTDVGDISYVVPTVGIITATWPRGVAPHSWAAVAASGDSFGLKAAVVAAKTIANIAAELMRSPERLELAKKELEAKRGPNFTYHALFGTRSPPIAPDK